MRQLTKEAKENRDEFELMAIRKGCTCLISSPCQYCLHPGNPWNQDGECYEEITPPVNFSDITKSLCK